MFRSGGFCAFDGVLHKTFEDRRIVLEEFTREEFQFNFTDFFGDDLTRIGNDAFFAFAEKQRGTAFKLTGGTMDFFAGAAVGGVDGIGR